MKLKPIEQQVVVIDSLLVLIGFQGQQTNELKSAEAPHNLYEPVLQHDRVEGDFGILTVPSLSLSIWPEAIVEGFG